MRLWTVLKEDKIFPIRSSNMRKKILVLHIAVIMTTIALGGDLNQVPKFSLIAIHAHLYHQSTGTVNTRDLLDGGELALWNTPIGEGESRSPSAALWILVEIEGPDFVNDLDGRLVLKVSDGTRTILHQTLILYDWLSRDKKLILPFLAYGTGCKKLTVVAKLEGYPESLIDVATLEKIVPFECGE